MSRYAALVLAVLLLASCASGPSQYLLGMQTYQGKTEAQLIDALGPPDNQYTVEGVKYLSYYKVTQQVYPTGGSGVGFGTGVGGGRYGGSGMWMDQTFGNSRSAAVQTFRCDVYFAIKRGLVDKVGHRGNSC